MPFASFPFDDEKREGKPNTMEVHGMGILVGQAKMQIGELVTT